MTVATSNTTVRTVNLTASGAPVVGSPAWWVDRLYARLMARRPDINLYDDYYQGNFPLPWLAPQAADEFRRILKMSRANYLGLVVDAMCERMAVEGFRLNVDSDMDNASTSSGQPPARAKNAPGTAVKHTGNTDMAEADKDLWRIWQANSLDTYFDQGLLEAAINGSSYLLVAPNPKDPRTPKIWVEHAAQMIVEYVPGTNRTETAAALKVWTDDWTGGLQATLYTPEWIWKFTQEGTRQLGNMAVASTNGVARVSEVPLWGPRIVRGEDAPVKNPLAVVPVFELPNNPRLLSGGQSELYDLIDPQDRIVKTLADRLMTQDFGAFPQKWASAWPEDDANGNPTPEIEVGRNRMITTEVAETRFGQFAAADLQGYIDSKREDVKDIASRSRTPAQYLLGEMNNVNGDTLKASESGLVAKVKQRMRGHNDPTESAMRLARRIASGGSMSAEQAESEISMEVIWRNPEFRTEGELVDALLKMSDLGVPEEALWERWGATPQEVERWKAMLEDKMQRAAAGDATVVLADRFREMAAGQMGDDSNANGGGGSRNGGGTNSAGTQPGQPRGTKGPGNSSGGQSSSSASKQRPNARPASRT